MSKVRKIRNLIKKIYKISCDSDCDMGELDEAFIQLGKEVYYKALRNKEFTIRIKSPIRLLPDEYDLYKDILLKTVKKKGILVETLEKGTPFVFEKRTQYKKDLGAVPVKDICGNITNVYMVYEDYDGSIKYYDYPQFSKRDVRRGC